MDLQTLVNEFGGIERAAKKLGTSPRQVCYWKSGEHLPRAETLVEIYKMSGKKLDINLVLNNYIKFHDAKRK